MKRRRYKNIIALLLAIILVAQVSTGCGKGTENTPAPGTDTENTPVPTASGTEQSGSEGLDEGGITNATGLPITKEPITIKAVVKTNVLFPDMATSNVWKTVADATNINLELEVLEDDEKVDLMFASGDFPDLVLSTNASANHMAMAVDGGYFVELEPLLEKYAPAWYEFLQKNPLVYNSSLATDGKLYGLPYTDFDPAARNLRDQWIIMKSWLDELNLEVPTTTEEFKNALLAIKNNAGKGSIPSDVIPYYFLYDSYIGGQFDIYGSFGVYITSGDYLYVDNGVVKDQSTNPAIKEPLKYLKELYGLGLIPPEVFTDDWNNYVSKITSDPAIVGSYGSYINRQMDTATALKPLDSGNGSTPLMRSQAYTPAPANVAIITSNNKYPVATTRLLEMLATDTELKLTVGRGTKGIVWDYDENNKAYSLFWEENQELWRKHSKELGIQNSFPNIFDTNFYENVWKDINIDVPNSRTWAYYNVYEDCVMPNDMVYVSGALDEDDNNMLKLYATDLTNYRKTAFADFITGKQDIDAGWDAYVAKMNELGLKSFVELKQKGYDIIMQ